MFFKGLDNIWLLAYLNARILFSRRYVYLGDQNAGRIHSVRIDNSIFDGWNNLNIWEQL